MKDKIFLDSNLLIYAHTNVEPAKQSKIQNIILNQNTFVSTQVLKEVANVLNKKFAFNWTKVKIVLQEISTNNELHINKTSTVLMACDIAHRYKFSFYDSLIIAAALQSNCSTLYSEDMQDGQIIEQSLTIKNPFF